MDEKIYRERTAGAVRNGARSGWYEKKKIKRCRFSNAENSLIGKEKLQMKRAGPTIAIVRGGERSNTRIDEKRQPV